MSGDGRRSECRLIANVKRLVLIKPLRSLLLANLLISVHQVQSEFLSQYEEGGGR